MRIKISPYLYGKDDHMDYTDYAKELQICILLSFMSGMLFVSALVEFLIERISISTILCIYMFLITLFVSILQYRRYREFK